MKRILLEIGGALIACIALGMAIGPNDSELQVLPVLPLVLVLTYWAGKYRESGLSLQEFTSRPSAETRRAMEATSNVRPLGQHTWCDCKIKGCGLTFKTPDMLFAHQLEDHDLDWKGIVEGDEGVAA